jgi:hypothetical protein
MIIPLWLQNFLHEHYNAHALYESDGLLDGKDE